MNSLHIFTLCIIFGQTLALDFADCGSIHYVSNLEIENCTEQPCSLCIGKNVNVTFNISTRSENQALTNDVALSHRGAKLPLTASPDPCKAMKCPIANSFETTYQAVLKIENVYPMQADLIWILQDNEKKQQMVCISVPVRVYSSENCSF